LGIIAAEKVTMTTVQILLAIAIVTLFAIMITPTIMALSGPRQAVAVRMMAAVVIFTALWVADTLHPFPDGTYQAGLWMLAPVLVYFTAQHYMNSVYTKEKLAGGVPLTAGPKYGQLLKSTGQVLACATVAIVAAYLPAQVYLFLWEKIDGTAAGVAGVLF
jgi:hypothetical protein